MIRSVSRIALPFNTTQLFYNHRRNLSLPDFPCVSVPQTQPPFQRSEDHSTGREHVPQSSLPLRDSLYLALFIVWLLTVFPVFSFAFIHWLHLNADPAPNGKWLKIVPADFLWERIICSVWHREQWQWIVSVYVSAALALSNPLSH